MKVLAAFLANTIANFLIGLLVAKFLGPEEYGRFALSFSIAVVAQIALFDWLRLAATRFYSAQARREAPEIRATLDASFILLAAALAIGGGLFLYARQGVEPGDALIALALALAIVNGSFDYSTALLRARFEDRLYVRMMLVKNVLALALTGGGAFLFHSAGIALAGSLASLFGAALTARGALRDPGASPLGAQSAAARMLIGYSAPIVAANLLYQSVPLAARAFVASFYGFAETGQLSLAYDLGIRAVQALGSALDVLLFQIAVAAHERHGPDRAKEQIARNMAIVIAFLAPGCVGIWLIMPSIEELIVPAQFRGPFGRYLDLLLPGLFAMAIIQFAVAPVFQIAKRTQPLIAAASIAAASGLVLALVLPRGDDASSLALAQCGAYIVALVALIGFAARAEPQWPRPRDLLATAVAVAAMTLALQPTRSLPPGLFTLVVQIGAGAGVYGALTLLLDTAGLRGTAAAALRPVLARARAAF